MTLISKNLKFLRKKHSLTQGQLAEQLGIKRSLIGAYEEGRAEPRVNNLTNIAALFDVPVDALITKEIEHNKGPLVSSGMKVLAVTVDALDREQVQLVPQKAAAGYLNGFSDPEYISDLPTLSIPNLPTGTLRGFEVSGDSMLPLTPGTVIVGKYVEDMQEIKNGKTYVLVTREEGIVYKRLERKARDSDVLTLRSDNTNYSPYELSFEDVLEVWEANVFISRDFPEQQQDMGQLLKVVMELQQEVMKLRSSN